MQGNWQWAAYGKHPVVKDYFKLGQYGSLVKAFSDWMDSGYQRIAAKRKSSSYSWRFWARGLKRDGLGCGVVRDSLDQLARPYPLLIMGAGQLAGWEDQWDLIPLACERTWAQMEYLYTKTLDSLKQLEEETQKIPPPLSEWAELREGRRNSLEGPPSSNPQSPSWGREKGEEALSRLLPKTELFLSLDPGLFADPWAEIRYLHYLLKRGEKNIPQAVFMGGTLEKTLLAVFKRSVAPADFVQLWSVSSSEGN
jgi:type VI secretion system protein VasJ